MGFVTLFGGIICSFFPFVAVHGAAYGVYGFCLYYVLQCVVADVCAVSVRNGTLFPSLFTVCTHWNWCSFVVPFSLQFYHYVFPVLCVSVRIYVSSRVVVTVYSVYIVYESNLSLCFDTLCHCRKDRSVLTVSYPLF